MGNCLELLKLATSIGSILPNPGTRAPQQSHLRSHDPRIPPAQCCQHSIRIAIECGVIDPLMLSIFPELLLRFHEALLRKDTLLLQCEILAYRFDIV